MAENDFSDCGDKDCDNCDVCDRLNFLDWAYSVGGDFPRVIEENIALDAYIEKKYGFNP